MDGDARYESGGDTFRGKIFKVSHLFDTLMLPVLLSSTPHHSSFKSSGLMAGCNGRYCMLSDLKLLNISYRNDL